MSAIPSIFLINFSSISLFSDSWLIKARSKSDRESLTEPSAAFAISLSADGAADYQRIVDIMDVARFSGIRRVELATRKLGQD